MTNPSTSPVDVACYGELLWDFFETETKGMFRREPGGSAVNTAIVLARLNAKPSVVGAVGKDKLGQALEAALSSEGVDVSHVAALDARTGITFVTRDASGEPSFVPYRSGTADLALPEGKVNAATAKARFALVSSSCLLPRARAASEKFLAAVEKAKTPLFVDMNVHAHMWESADDMRASCTELVGRAAVVKASEDDLAAVAGKRGMTWLEEKAKGAIWVMTRGENGAAALGEGVKATAPTKRVRKVDATGGGDAFTAGVLAVLLKANVKPGSAEWKDTKTWTRALEVGHLLGAKAITGVGATSAVVQLDDVRARVEAAKKG